MTAGILSGRPGGSRHFPAEKLVILSVSFFALLLLLDHLFGHNPEVLLLPASLAVILIFWWLPRGRKKYEPNPVRLFVCSALSLAGYAYLYKLAGALVHFLRRPWQDEFLVSLDRIIFGFSPNQALSGFQPAWLTELMMFAYLAYLPLVVWLAYVLFRKQGQAGLQTYTFALGLAYLTCFILFILVPAASPRFYFEGLVPEGGWLFSRLMNLVETSAQYRGGSFPSAHCAAGTVMLYFALKAGKRVAAVVVPLILLFFLSTVYGQYHYGVDVLAGVLIGLLAIPLSAKMLRGRLPGQE